MYSKYCMYIQYVRYLLALLYHFLKQSGVEDHSSVRTMGKVKETNGCLTTVLE